jgi:hypothetical protein
MYELRKKEEQKPEHPYQTSIDERRGICMAATKTSKGSIETEGFPPTGTLEFGLALVTLTSTNAHVIAALSTANKYDRI